MNSAERNRLGVIISEWRHRMHLVAEEARHWPSEYADGYLSAVRECTDELAARLEEEL